MDTISYENLVSPSHHVQPRYMDFVRMVLSQVADMGSLLESFEMAFDLDAAVGAQLDVLGAIVQAERVLPFSPMSAPRHLGDEDYRLRIRAAIAANTWDGTNESLARMFSNVFPSFGIVLEDKQDMSINVIIRGSFTKLQVEMVNAGLLIPHPAGVAMTYEIPETIVSTDVIIQAGIYQSGHIRFQ